LAWVIGIGSNGAIHVHKRVHGDVDALLPITPWTAGLALLSVRKLERSWPPSLS
jgi:hypothetical protein